MTRIIPHKTINGTQLKFCGTCQKYLPLNNYNTCKRNWDNLVRQCKFCRKAYRKRRNEKKILFQGRIIQRRKIPHKTINGCQTKFCGTCKKYLPLNNYNKCKKNWDKLLPRCKCCQKLYRMKLKEKNIEKIVAKKIKYWKQKLL